MLQVAIKCQLIIQDHFLSIEEKFLDINHTISSSSLSLMMMDISLSEVVILEDSSGTGDLSQLLRQLTRLAQRSPEETRKEIWRSVVCRELWVRPSMDDGSTLGLGQNTHLYGKEDLYKKIKW